MINLDDIKSIECLDASNLRKTIAEFPSQFQLGVELLEDVDLSSIKDKPISSICFTALGGSAIGADFVRHLLMPVSTKPLQVNRYYHLPHSAQKETLVIAISYSGNTDATISACKEAFERGCPLVIFSSGGEIESFASKNKIPFIKFPSGYPPRTTLGYSVVSQLTLLNNLNLFSLDFKDISETSELLSLLAREQYSFDVPERDNVAKQIARQIYGTYPIIYASTMIESIALRWRQQFEENAKLLASHHSLPEMAHNEMIGWKNPEELLKNFSAIFLLDKEDHSRIQKHVDFSKKVIEKTGAEIVTLSSQGSSFLTRMFSLAYLSDFVSFYLAMLYEVDPTPIDVTNQLRNELARS